MILNVLCLKIVFEVSVCKLQKNEVVKTFFIFTTTLSLKNETALLPIWKQHRSISIIVILINYYPLEEAKAGNQILERSYYMGILHCIET